MLKIPVMTLSLQSLTQGSVMQQFLNETVASLVSQDYFVMPMPFTSELCQDLTEHLSAHFCNVKVATLKPGHLQVSIRNVHCTFNRLFDFQVSQGSTVFSAIPLGSHVIVH